MPIPKIKVIGIGGAGCNTIRRLSKLGLKNIDLIAANTDAQSLKNSLASSLVLLGEKTTKGLGAGMDYKLGRKAAQESREALKKTIEGAQVVFLTAGLGGGTGTSGISVAGEVAKDLGVLSLAVVTLPFSFEGSLRQRIANIGLKNLEESVDAYLCIPNDRILKVAPKTATIEEAFLEADRVINSAIEGIFSILSSPGIISVDFADLEEILRNSGRILFGVGVAKGENRAVAAASKALQSPLLDFSIKQAEGILFNIEGRDLSLFEVNLVANFFKKIADKKTKIIFGVSESRTLPEGEIKVSLIASGVK